MSKLHSDESGFSVIEGMVIIIILLAVGFAGYKVYNRSASSSNSPVSVVDINGLKTYIPKSKLTFESHGSIQTVGVDGTDAQNLVNKLHPLGSSQYSNSSVLSADGKYIAYFNYEEPVMTIHVLNTATSEKTLVATYDGPANDVTLPFYGWAGHKLTYTTYVDDNTGDHFYSIKLFDADTGTSSVAYQTPNDYDFSESINDVHVLDDSIVFLHGYQLMYLKLDGSQPVVVTDFTQAFADLTNEEQVTLIRTGLNSFRIGQYNNVTNLADKYYDYTVGGSVTAGTDSSVLANFMGTFIFDYPTGGSTPTIPQAPNGNQAWLDATSGKIKIGSSDANARALNIKVTGKEASLDYFYPYQFIGNDYLILTTAVGENPDFYVVSTKGGVPTKLVLNPTAQNN